MIPQVKPKYVLIIASDGLGRVIFMRRRDTKKYSIVAGHIEEGEAPEAAAVREVHEETGLILISLTRIYEQANPLCICYSALCQGTPTISLDPDHEASKCMWVDVRNGIPSNIWNNLAGPDNDTNIVRQLFDKVLNIKKNEELTWLEAGFMDLYKDESKSSVTTEAPATAKIHEKHLPLASTQKAPKKLSVTHKAKESKDKNLLVVHNLNSENLEHAHELGGLAAPSLAIHNKRHPFTHYGEISLVAHPSLVDPKASVPVFNADAYSARHPRPNFEVDKKKLKQLKVELLPHAKKVGEEYPLHDTLEDEIRRHGAREAIEHRSLVPTLQSAFLAEHGYNTPKIMQDVRLGNPLVHEKPVKEFFQQHGADPNFKYGGEYHKKLSAAAKAAGEEFAKKHTDIDPIDFTNTDPETGHMAFNAANNLIKDHYNVGKTEVDKYATQDALDQKVRDLGLENEFNKWAINKVKPVQSTPYIPKPSGRKQPYTMENILKHMTRKVNGSEESGAMFGTGFARAKGAKKFASLDAIKKDQGKLVSAEGMEQYKKELEDKFGKVANKLTPLHYDKNTFKAMDAIVEALGESYKRGGSLKHELARAGFENVPDDVVEELRGYGKDLVNAPSQYWEAKPQRKVDIGEFKGAAVPHNVSPETLDILKHHGINHIEKYNREDPNDRLRAVNKIADAQDLKLSEKSW